MTQMPPATISTLAIRRHIGTLVITLAVVVLGLFVVGRMPVDLLPSITYPRIGVRADAPGVVPEVAVNEVTRPLEEALAATEGVVQIFSQTREGRISIDLFFKPGEDIDQALNDATATLNRARDVLPDTVDQPRLFKFDPSQLPVYEIALTSASLEPVALRVFADEELARELLRVPGVANVDVSGGVQEEVQVNLDLQRLQAVGLDLTDVLDALEERNQDTSGGLVRGGGAESLTRLVGKFSTADEVRNLAIEIEDTTPPQQVYLRDIAEVIDGTEEQRIRVNLNGQPAVKVSVQKQPDANTIAVVDGVKAKLDTLRDAGLIPADMDMVATLDESRYIRNSIKNVAIAGLTGAALAAIAVLFFLGSLRQTIVIVLAIPLATLTALLLMGVFGLSLNVFSLGGLALGVGIVVDNAIVMLENIAKGVAIPAKKAALAAGSINNNGRINETSGRAADRAQGRAEIMRQAEESSRELESALLASTTTNLVAVLPFLLIGGFIALLFSELILTISFAVAASLIIALTVVPALASRLFAIRWSSGVDKLGPILAFGRQLDRLTQSYSDRLSWVLRHRLLVIAIAFLILGGSSVWMAGQLPQEILPRIDTGQASLRVQFPPSTPIEDNQRVMSAIDDLLLAQPETEYAFTTSGGALFASITSENALRGSSTVTLKPGSNISTYVDQVNQIIGEQIPVVDTSIRVRPDSVRGLILTNSPTRDDIDVLFQGTSVESLDETGRIVLEALNQNATLARYQFDAAPPLPEVQIRPDWERAADLGLTARALGDTIQTALDGAVPTQLQRSDRLVDIRVQLPPGSVQVPSQLSAIPLFTADNQAVQLGDVAEIEAGQAPGEIQRINQRQILLIEGSLAEGASLSEALAEVDAILADLELPEDVIRLPSFVADANQALQSSLRTLSLLAVFLVFVVMALQYNSLIDPLVIILTVPLALAGGIWGLFFTQTAVGATVIVGAVLLVGIVVNNAIILVELANQIRDRDSVGTAVAMLNAAPQRLRPILMTTVTTVLGLFPLALGIGEGSEFLQPLGIVVFSGLALATVLTLFIIPCFYVLLHDWLGGDRIGQSPLQDDAVREESAVF
ncbi:MAG: efflux RND transporter permease subunit [Elainellaceae cyanobacterium]